jgi:hypothetical protein
MAFKISNINRKYVGFTLALISIALLSACGGGGGSSSDSADTTPAPQPSIAPSSISGTLDTVLCNPGDSFSARPWLRDFSAVG